MKSFHDTGEENPAQIFYEQDFKIIILIEVSDSLDVIEKIDFRDDYELLPEGYWQT